MLMKRPPKKRWHNKNPQMCNFPLKMIALVIFPKKSGAFFPPSNQNPPTKKTWPTDPHDNGAASALWPGIWPGRFEITVRFEWPTWHCETLGCDRGKVAGEDVRMGPWDFFYKCVKRDEVFLKGRMEVVSELWGWHGCFFQKWWWKRPIWKSDRIWDAIPFNSETHPNKDQLNRFFDLKAESLARRNTTIDGWHLWWLLNTVHSDTMG